MEEFKKDQEGYKTKKLGPRMDTYENIMVVVNGSDTGALMRRLDDGANTSDNKPGNMHKYLGKDDAVRTANLVLFKHWIGSWNLKRAKEITEEERKMVLAPATRETLNYSGTHPLRRRLAGYFRPSHLSSIAYSFSGSTGLLMKSFIPAAMQVLRSSSKALAVIARIGTRWCCGN